MEIREEKHEEKIRTIYEALKRLGFPDLEEEELSSEEEVVRISLKGIMLKIGKYIQGTDSRLKLLSWLVNQVKPGSCDHRQPRVEVVEVLVERLSQMGLLPLSKHTKNLDYSKYVEGLLGFEGAVTLVHKACLFVKRLKQVKRREKPDSKMPSLVKDISQNKQDLVNPKYDPFGIKFPEAFGDLSEVQFDQRYWEFVSKLESGRETNRKQMEPDDSFMQTSADTKERFRTTLSQLIASIHNPSNTDTPSKEEPERSRLVEMDGEFVNIYRKFVKFISFDEEKSEPFHGLYSRLDQRIEEL